MSVAEDKSGVVVVIVVDIDNGCSGSEVCSESDEEQRSFEIVGMSEKDRGSSVSECCVVSVDVDLKAHFAKVERDCRICHLSMDMTNHNHESGTPIELGCSCKDDLAVVHKQCVEAWFKIKGNKTCEIRGSIARNVTGVVEVEMTEQWNEANDASMVPPTRPAPLQKVKISGRVIGS